jgi:alkylglycerol monooxygenase
LVISVILLTFMTGLYGYLVTSDKLFIVAFVLLTLVNCGALMEQRKWIYYLECARLFLLLAYFFWKLDIIELLSISAVVLFALEHVFRLGHLYRHYVLRYEKIQVKS